MRVDFVKAVTNVLQRDPAGLLITGDLGFMAFEDLAARLEHRFINAGIAEQNMVGLAAGTALAGLRPWVYSIAPFATYRCVEQIRNDVCLHDLPVRVVGNGGGYTYGVMGSTHHALEDLAVLKALPNLQLFFPCANDHVAAAVDAMATLAGPAYLRLGISPYNTDFPLISERADTLTRHYATPASATPPKLTIVGAGQGIQLVLHALRNLDLARHPVDVFGVARYPFCPNDEELLASVARSRKVLFVEEHYGPGGMGESFVAGLSGLQAHTIVCARYDKAQRYGSPRFHLQQCNLTPEAVLSAASRLIEGGV